MPPLDPADFQVQLSLTGGAGSFAWNIIADMDSFQWSLTPQSTTTKFVFGQTAGYTSTSAKVDNYSLGGLWTTDDTNGQTAMRNAAENSTAVWLLVITDDTPAAEAGWYQQVKVNEPSLNIEREGDFGEAAFTLTGEQTAKVNFTGGIPT